jgi:hypothetical protein
MEPQPDDEQPRVPLDQFWSNVKTALKEWLFRNEPAVEFDFDFVESATVNAWAALIAGVAFIGVSTALRQVLWNICARLSTNDIVAARFNAKTIEQRQTVCVEIFSTVLGFVFCHEYGHHKLNHHVHLPGATSFYSDVMNGIGSGGIDDQAKEIHADGYAVYFVIYGLIAGDRRPMIDKNFGTQIADETLLSLFIISIAAFFFIGEPKEFDPATVEQLTHPPAAIRLNFIMYHAKRWCEESRPDIVPLLTLSLFQELIAAVKTTIWQQHTPAWPEQDAFGHSPDGAAYILKLSRGYDALQEINRQRSGENG